MTDSRPNDADFALSGNWYDPVTSGQGLSVEVNPVAGVIFFAWYTYAPSFPNIGATGQRWYTGQGDYIPGSRSGTALLYETTGGLFDAATPKPATVQVGTASLIFESCVAAQLTYAFSGGTNSGLAGTIALTRLGPAPGGCEGEPSLEAARALEVALRYLGTPYQWGGSTPETGFDAAGLVQYSYLQVGIQLPRTADQQFLSGTAVSASGLLPGDLVFFMDPSGYVYHVGMSLGPDEFVHAPHTGDVVKISLLSEPYYAGHFAGARRIK
jgi:hypothetical protein